MTKSDSEKLDILAEIEGFDSPEDLMEAFIIDSVCPAICMNPDCEYTTMMEPDQDRGWCECCETQTVKSAMVLAGVI